MRRRRLPWRQIAAMARKAEGAWRLHPRLAAADHHLLQHARRRARPLQPTTTHEYEYARGNSYVDDLGKEHFDLYVRFVPKGINP